MYARVYKVYDRVYVAVYKVYVGWGRCGGFVSLFVGSLATVAKDFEVCYGD